ncbi:MAG: Chromosome-partitioning protein Spo0J [Dehalococcoidia bacterium]|nr:Chromosome-partitioning protein Spo0J [Bacillota bacterium]
MNEVSISLLKPHPKNQSYYDNLPEEKYQEVKRSIESHGIRDPLKVLPDFTVIAGHQRLRIALELGLEKVPVTVVDISPEEAEYLLIADNEERRQDDTDPIRKAKRARFLAEYWGVRLGKGGDRGNQYTGKISEVPKEIISLGTKSLEDVAEAISEDVRTTKNILKLNDLIPPLQTLVSSGTLGQTAAYSLAFLPSSEQASLLSVLGETGVCGLSVKDAQALRSDLDIARAEKEKLQARLVALEKEKQVETDALQAKLTDLAQKPIEIETEKIVYKPDPAVTAELEATKKYAVTLLKEQEALTERLAALAADRVVKETRLEKSENRQFELEGYLDHARKEIEKLKSRPRPKLDQKRVNCHTLMEKASLSALALADALKVLEDEYADDLLSVARVRGGHEVEELATSILDAGLFASFNSTLETAIERIDRIADIIRAGKPKLRIIKNDN